MELNEAQEQCLKTNTYKTNTELMVCCILGVNSEAGEVAGKLDKWMRKNHNLNISPEFKKEMALELFDVMWFVSGAAKSLGYTFEELMQMGLEKLADRAKRNQIQSLEGGDHR